MSCLCGDRAERYKDTLEEVLKYLTEWASVFDSQGMAEVAGDMSRKALEIHALLSSDLRPGSAAQHA